MLQASWRIRREDSFGCDFLRVLSSDRVVSLYPHCGTMLNGCREDASLKHAPEPSGTEEKLPKPRIDPRSSVLMANGISLVALKAPYGFANNPP